MQKLLEKEFVSIPELVEISGLSDSTLYRLAKAGKLPGAGFEPYGVMRRNKTSGNLQPRYHWTVHLETFMAWWQKFIEASPSQRIRVADLPEVSAVTAEPKMRRRIPQSVIAKIERLRVEGYSAGTIHRTLKHYRATGGDVSVVPSLASVRNYAQRWDDLHGKEHVERKRSRTKPTDKVIDPEKTAESAEQFPAVKGNMNSHEAPKVSEYNSGHVVKVSIGTSFVCGYCKEFFEQPERLALCVIRPGRRAIQKDVVTHVLCGASCVVKFVGEKEELEWTETALRIQEPAPQDITFPFPKSAPEPLPTKATGNLWRRFRDLVGGKG